MSETIEREIDMIREKLGLDEVRLLEGRIYIRQDHAETDDFGWTPYIDLRDDLNKIGYEFAHDGGDEPYIEHDCVSGFIQKIATPPALA